VNINLDDTCYHIHHIPKSSLIRFILSKNIDRRLKNKIVKIESKSIGIYNEKDLLCFKETNPLFKIDKPKEYQYNFRYPEIGLWAGSYVLFKNFLLTDYKYLMIFEDDILLDKDFFSLFKYYSEGLPSDWDCFFLFQTEPTVDGGYDSLPDIYKTSHKDIWHAHHNWSTAGMLMTRDAVKKLVHHIENDGIRLPLDQLILETDGDIPDPKATYRLLRSYSLARYSKRMSRILNIKTRIQNGSFIDL
jgi:GR25 family glycosyltransferase involved in LPS biosynthesis